MPKTPKIKRLITQKGYAKKHNIDYRLVHYHLKRGNYETVTLQCGTTLIVDKD